jgi:hypothetical protein
MVPVQSGFEPNVLTNCANRAHFKRDNKWIKETCCKRGSKELWCGLFLDLISHQLMGMGRIHYSEGVYKKITRGHVEFKDIVFTHYFYNIIF